MLIGLGVNDIIVCDEDGILYEGDIKAGKHKNYLAPISNKEKKQGTLQDALKNADVFIGMSVPNVLNADMIRSMNSKPIIFAMANPVAKIFPGIFREALDVRARKINAEMKLAAVYAIADIIGDDELNEEYIIPDPFDKRIVARVAKDVK